MQHFARHVATKALLLSQSGLRSNLSIQFLKIFRGSMPTDPSNLACTHTDTPSKNPGYRPDVLGLCHCIHCYCYLKYHNVSCAKVATAAWLDHTAHCSRDGLITQFTRPFPFCRSASSSQDYACPNSGGHNIHNAASTHPV